MLSLFKCTHLTMYTLTLQDSKPSVSHLAMFNDVPIELRQCQSPL